MSEIKFQRNIDDLLLQADETGIWIHCGWSMGVPRAKAVEYVKNRNSNPNSGFFAHGGKIILSHNDGKITFSQQEGEAIVDLIKAAYPEA